MTSALKYPDTTLSLAIWTVFIFLLELFIKVDCWKIQLCMNGSLLEAQRSDECKYGIWFTKPRAVHKICFEGGVWAIYQEFCEENPLIFTVHPSTKGCISQRELGPKIFGMVSLGQQDYGAIISTSSRRLFFSNHKLKHGMMMNFVSSSPELDILTWGPPADSFSLQQVRSSENDFLQQCLIKGRHSFIAYYKVKLERYLNVSFFLAKNLCKNRPRDVSGPQVQVRQSEIDFNIIQSSSEDIEMNCVKYVPIATPTEEPAMLDEEEIGLDEEEDDSAEKILNEETVGKIEERVDEETHRITLGFVAHYFDDDITPKNTFENSEFLAKAIEIFNKVCPPNMVPDHFIHQIYLLFQIIVIESEKLFPDPKNGNVESAQRIIGYLDKCLATANMFQYKIGAPCTREIPFLKTQFENGTKVYMLVEMPSFLKIDVVNFDLILEVIWKVMNFVDYYCADMFENQLDHTILGNHWQSLFSPLVVRRWKYPGRSFKVMKKVFASIDLEDAIRFTDYCVSAAKLHSHHSAWLRRPVSKRQKLAPLDNDTEAKLIWDDQAYCMDDYMLPALKLGYPIEPCGIHLSGRG